MHSGNFCYKTHSWNCSIRHIIYLQADKCVPVYVSVGHVHKPCKNGWMDRGAIWGVTLVVPRNRVLDGGPDIPREGAISVVVRLTKKHCESLLRCMQQKINNGISAIAATDCIATRRCHINFPLGNSAPAMRPFIKILFPTCSCLRRVRFGAW